jgi:molybdopterin molybdotransferase
VRLRGEEIQEGAVLVPAGTPLGIPELGLLWAQGKTQVRVARRPRVAILSTGDELCALGDSTPEGIVDTNGPSLTLSVSRAGGEPTYLGIAKDRPDDLRRKLEAALGHDLVITSAGVSVGEHDLVRQVLQELGVEMDFWRVAIKPGKPLAFGRRGDTFFFGLPGNPASSLVTFELFVRPAIRRLLGWGSPLPSSIQAKTGVALSKSAGIAQFYRVTTRWQDGELWAYPLATQSSGAVRSTASATHLLHLPREQRAATLGQAMELITVAWGA